MMADNSNEELTGAQATKERMLMLEMKKEEANYESRSKSPDRRKASNAEEISASKSKKKNSSIYEEILVRMSPTAEELNSYEENIALRS